MPRTRVAARQGTICISLSQTGRVLSLLGAGGAPLLHIALNLIADTLTSKVGVSQDALSGLAFAEVGTIPASDVTGRRFWHCLELLKTQFLHKRSLASLTCSGYFSTIANCNRLSDLCFFRLIIHPFVGSSVPELWIVPTPESSIRDISLKWAKEEGPPPVAHHTSFLLPVLPLN